MVNDIYLPINSPKHDSVITCICNRRKHVCCLSSAVKVRTKSPLVKFGGARIDSNKGPLIIVMLIFLGAPVAQRS